MDASSEPEDDPALQPVQNVPEEWLASFEHSDAARRLALLQADRDLLDQLMWGGYTGLDYELFADTLARYGLAVITAWSRTGAIFAKCAEKGWVIENQIPISDGDAEGLANLTVAVALQKFRETVLIPRVWDYRKGASLKTFFVGQCLLRFLNVYRSWWRSERRRAPICADPTVLAERESSAPKPGEELLADERYAGLLDELTDDRDTRLVVIYKAEGYSDEEISELTGLSIPTVKSRLFRLRKKVKKSA